MSNNVIISTDIKQTLAQAVEEVPHDKLFVLTDETTHSLDTLRQRWLEEIMQEHSQ